MKTGEGDVGAAGGAEGVKEGDGCDGFGKSDVEGGEGGRGSVGAAEEDGVVGEFGAGDVGEVDGEGLEGGCDEVRGEVRGDVSSKE